MTLGEASLQTVSQVDGRGPSQAGAGLDPPFGSRPRRSYAVAGVWTNGKCGRRPLRPNRYLTYPGVSLPLQLPPWPVHPV